jgi:hypothetical protein
MLNPLLCVKVDCRKPQSIVKRDLRPPAGSSGFGDIELQGANDAVTRLRAPAHLQQRIQYRIGAGKRRGVMPTAAASRLMNSGVETCSSSATGKTSKFRSGRASRCTMNEQRFSTPRNARRLQIEANGSGKPRFTASVNSLKFPFAPAHRQGAV